jgi:hypothetical protein
LKTIDGERAWSKVTAQQMMRGRLNAHLIDSRKTARAVGGVPLSLCADEQRAYGSPFTD